ncbi:MAG: hypothetical protein DWQ51_15030 [Microcystis wesenbergii TW10]|jgi:hypothetical protein|nr:MAG: hypothetical protein DWQ51_15030 [Microcystis wesenbergii TW10]
MGKGIKPFVSKTSRHLSNVKSAILRMMLLARKNGTLRLSPLDRPPIAAVLKKTLSTRLTIINTVA